MKDVASRGTGPCMCLQDSVQFIFVVPLQFPSSLQMSASLSGQLSSLAAPVIFSFVVSLYVANVAMQIFGFAADTILQVGQTKGLKEGVEARGRVQGWSVRISSTHWSFAPVLHVGISAYVVFDKLRCIHLFVLMYGLMSSGS